MKRNFMVLAALAALALGSTGCDKLKARDNLKRGVQAFTNAKYPEAVAYFQKAVQLDPSFTTTHTYLAIAYMSQYIPGAESQENVRMAENAFNEFQEVLRLDPKDENATAYIAKLYFDQKKMDQAMELQKGDRHQSEEQGSVLHDGSDRLVQLADTGSRSAQQNGHESRRSRSPQG